MTLNDYKEQRLALADELQNMLESDDADAIEAKTNQIKELDASWEALSEAQANARAMIDNKEIINMVNVATQPVVQIAEAVAVEKMGGSEMTKAEAIKSKAYENAWAKYMMDVKAFTEDESKAFEMVNDAYTHTTGNTAVVIPETIAANIWAEVAAAHPLWADVAKTYVKGAYTVIKKVSSTAAAWYAESTATDDGTETLTKVELNGCELARAITISWKLKEMAIADFLVYIQSQMAEAMGAALSYGVAHGAGVVSGNPSEPKGIITALNAESNTPQVITYTANDGIVYANLTAARAKVKSGYTPAVYANASTIWNKLANVVDSTGRPLFVPDATAGGVYRILGCIVKEEAGLNDGEVLFADAAKGYIANVNKDITVSTEDHVKARTTDYCGYAIVDGAPVFNGAFALLKQGE